MICRSPTDPRTQQSYDLSTSRLILDDFEIAELLQICGASRCHRIPFTLPPEREARTVALTQPTEDRIGAIAIVDAAESLARTSFRS